MTEIVLVVGFLVLFAMVAWWLSWIFDYVIKDRDRWSDQWKMKHEELMRERYRVIALECELDDLRTSMLALVGKKPRKTDDDN